MGCVGDGEGDLDSDVACLEGGESCSRDKCWRFICCLI